MALTSLYQSTESVEEIILLIASLVWPATKGSIIKDFNADVFTS